MQGLLYMVESLADSAADARVQSLRQAGVAGVTLAACSPDQAAALPRWVTLLDQHRLAIIAVRTRIDVAATQVDAIPLDIITHPRLRGCVLELEMVSSSVHDKPSSPRADVRAAQLVRTLAPYAAASNMRIAMCPAEGHWLERTQDALRLGMRVNQPHVGLTFQWRDWLRTDGHDLTAAVHLALPRLWSVVLQPDIAAADRARWNPNNLNAAPLLSCLARLGYTGPIVLRPGQSSGDAETAEELIAAKTAWQQMILQR